MLMQHQINCNRTKIPVLDDDIQEHKNEDQMKYYYGAAGQKIPGEITITLTSLQSKLQKPVHLS